MGVLSFESLWSTVEVVRAFQCSNFSANCRSIDNDVFDAGQIVENSSDWHNSAVGGTAEHRTQIQVILWPLSHGQRRLPVQSNCSEHKNSLVLLAAIVDALKYFPNWLVCSCFEVMYYYALIRDICHICWRHNACCKQGGRCRVNERSISSRCLAWSYLIPFRLHRGRFKPMVKYFYKGFGSSASPLKIAPTFVT